MSNKFWGVIRSVTEAPYMGGYNVGIDFFIGDDGFSPDEGSNHATYCSFPLKVGANDGLRNAAAVEAYLKSNIFSGLSGIASDQWLYENYVSNIGRLAARFGCRYGAHTMSLFSQLSPEYTSPVLELSASGVISGGTPAITGDHLGASVGDASGGANSIPDAWALSGNLSILDRRAFPHAITGGASGNSFEAKYLAASNSTYLTGAGLTHTVNASAAFWHMYNYLGDITEPLWLRLILTINQLAPRYQIITPSAEEPFGKFREDFYGLALAPCMTKQGTRYDLLSGFTLKGGIGSAFGGDLIIPRAVVQSLLLPKYQNLQTSFIGVGGMVPLHPEDMADIGRADCLALVRGFEGQYSSNYHLNTVGQVLHANEAIYTDWYFSGRAPMNDATSYLLGVASHASSDSQIHTAMQSTGRRASPMAHRAAKLALLRLDLLPLAGNLANTRYMLSNLGIEKLPNDSITPDYPGGASLFTRINEINTQQYSWDDAYLK